MAPAKVDTAPQRPLLAMAVLIGLVAFGGSAIFGQSNRSGYGEETGPLINSDEPAFFPGSNRPILRHYTGVKGLDRFYVLINLFFANVTEFSRPELSLYCFQFGGQLPAFLTILLLESRRVAGPNILLRSMAIWGVMMQVGTFGCVAPLYFFLYFLLPRKSGSASEAAQLRDPVEMQSLIPAFLLGYVVPSLFMSYPYDNPFAGQWACTIWQTFPVYVVLILQVLTAIAKRTSIGLDVHTSKVQLSHRAINHAYSFAVTFGAITQWVTFSILFAAWAFPSALEEYVPASVVSTLTPGRVFVPTSPYTHERMESHGHAIHTFLHYDQYIGSAAMFVWAWALAQQAGVSISYIAVVRDTIYLGPLGAVAKIMWKRDEKLLATEKRAE